MAPRAFQFPEALARKDYTLRPEVDADEPFVFLLYASTRQEELANAPWSAEQKSQFLRLQFNAQNHHYKTYMPECDRRIIERGDRPIGRLYLEARPINLHIIDIALLPEARGHGIGTEILEALAVHAALSGRGLGIFVEKMNPALRLYQRLGFQEVADAGVYQEMERPFSAQPRSMSLD